jgi:hypothetical protein
MELKQLPNQIELCTTSPMDNINCEQTVNRLNLDLFYHYNSIC